MMPEDDGPDVNAALTAYKFGQVLGCLIYVMVSEPKYFYKSDEMAIMCVDFAAHPTFQKFDNLRARVMRLKTLYKQCPASFTEFLGEFKELRSKHGEFYNDVNFSVNFMHGLISSGFQR